jgi:hypothetical protein
MFREKEEKKVRTEAQRRMSSVFGENMRFQAECSETLFLFSYFASSSASLLLRDNFFLANKRRREKKEKFSLYI